MKNDSYAVTIERTSNRTMLVVYRNKQRLASFNVGGKTYTEQQRIQTALSNLLFDIANS